MKREKNFVKNTIIITFGKISTHLITFLLLPLYTGVLSTSEYGIVDLLHTLVALLLPIITLQVEQAMFRELVESREDNDNKKQIITNAILFVVIQLTIYLLFFLLITPFLNVKYNFLLVINIISAIFASLLLQIARGFGDNKKYAIGSFISAISTIFFNILFLLVIKLKIVGMLLGTFLGQVLCIIYLFVSLKVYKFLSFKLFNKTKVKELLKYSLPLVPNSISWWVFSASDRVVVSIFLGMSATGILSASNKFPAIIITIYNIFYLTFFENILIASKDDDIEDYYSKMFNLIFGFFLSLSICMISCMPFIFPIMININFSDSYELIPILVLANIFNILVSLFGVVFSIHKNTKEIAKTSIFSAIINLIVHLILIKFIGLYAAVVSTFVAYFVMALYRYFSIKRRYFKITIKKKMLISIFIVLPLILLFYYVNNVYTNILSVLISIIYLIYINKSSFHVIISMFSIKRRD